MVTEAFIFEALVKEIFVEAGIETTNKLGKVFDLVLESEGVNYLVEVKYYKTMRAQVSHIKKAITNVKKYAEAKSDEIDESIGCILVISSYLDPLMKSALELEEDTIIIDLLDLISITSIIPELREKLVNLLEIPNDILLHLHGRDIKEIFPSSSSSSSSIGEFETDCSSPILECKNFEPCFIEYEEDISESEGLIIKLKNLPLGKRYWSKYESLMILILQLLFKNDLKGWRTQYNSATKLNRYDCVCGVKKNSEFWVFLIEQLKSKYVLFEFKNYSKEIGQGEVLTTEKYLFDNAFRKVAIICTRQGANASALEMCMGAMRESGRLIVILNDDDIIEMLKLEDNGSDPSDYLLNKVDDFLMRLSR